METQTLPARDPELWHQTKARAGFEALLFTYLTVNALFWLSWALTTYGRFDPLPWPIWSTVFWGLGVATQGVRVYSGWHRTGLAEREYERLARKR